VATGEKAPDAFRTIGELSAELGVAQHILRYWESKFPQLRPLQRAGNRRYYRAEDVALARRIHRLLNEEGYTVKGVQKLLKAKTEVPAEAMQSRPVAAFVHQSDSDTTIVANHGSVDVERLKLLRSRLAAALET
jgi:DNA-binding transcriptional MerR regulator